tara:strand:- start:62 stop:586 length:525 start_codon:yes stop_codon:yes gene_type:complete
MKILLISDTHGNPKMIEAMCQIAPTFDLVIHLGDDYNDGSLFLSQKIPLIRVPGTWGQEYQDICIDNRRFEFFLRWKFFLTHTPTKDANDLMDDINPSLVLQQQDCDIFCHGHTHKPEIRKEGKVIILNPGHLKNINDRGFPASFSQIRLTEVHCHIQIVHFENRTIIDEVTLK